MQRSLLVLPAALAGLVAEACHHDIEAMAGSASRALEEPDRHPDVLGDDHVAHAHLGEPDRVGEPGIEGRRR